MVQQVKNLPAIQETQEMWVRSLGQEDPLEKEMATNPVYLPEKSMGRGAWRATGQGVAESDMTERLSIQHSRLWGTNLSGSACSSLRWRLYCNSLGTLNLWKDFNKI